MSGIDKMDSLIGMFPCKIKVRKWTMRVFLHMIDFTVVNAWLLYQLAHKKSYPTKKCLPQYDFKRYVSKCWMAQNESTVNRRLRTSVGRSKVPRSVRFDSKNHMPKCTNGYNKRKQCALCKRSTNLYCSKCNVHLCCFSRRNCFVPYHTVDRGNIINHADSDQESNPDELQSQENANSDYSDSV